MAVYRYQQNTQNPAPNQIEILQALIAAVADMSKISPYPNGNVAVDNFLNPYMNAFFIL